MQRRAIAAQYEMVKPGSFENEADLMWQLILGRYFDDDNYIISTHRSPNGDSSTGRTDVMVRIIQKIVNGQFKKVVILIVNKCVEFKTLESNWDEALDEV